MTPKRPWSKYPIAWWLAWVSLAVLGGCTAPVKLSEDFGASLDEMKQAQRRHPEPGSGTDASDGLDGRAAQRAVERYLNSFAHRPAVPPLPLSGEGSIVNPGSVAP